MLTVNDLMTINPIVATPGMSLRSVWERMRREAVRQMPVIEAGRLVGIITERDIRLVLRSSQFEQLCVEAVMTEQPITVTPGTPAYRAAEMLRSYKFGALPVVEGRRLVGIITVSDFLGRVATPAPLPDRAEFWSEVGVGFGEQ